ncbi:hypothetical protein MCOR18_004508 [Pyricularia oryzae]|nr:hypothetical protein MCOR18_004508 [Pyricularia oryzae]
MELLWQWYDSEPTLRCAVLTGTGRAFCAGADLRQWNDTHAAAKDGEDPRRHVPISTAGFGGMGNRVGKKPIVIACNGLAFGGGMEMVINADMVVAGTSAKFGLPEAGKGVVVLGGALPRLIRTVGKQRASELTLLGRTGYTAEQMRDWGIVNFVVEEARVLEEALKVAGEVAANSPDSVIVNREGLRLGWEGVGPELGTAMLAQGMFGRIDGGENMQEGVRSFVERRKPKWVDSKLTIPTRDLSTNINLATKCQASTQVDQKCLPRSIRHDVGLADVFVREHHSVQIGESPPAHGPCSLFDGTPGTRPPSGARCDGRGHAGSEGGPGARCALPVDNTAQVVTQSRLLDEAVESSCVGVFPDLGPFFAVCRWWPLNAPAVVALKGHSYDCFYATVDFSHLYFSDDAGTCTTETVERDPSISGDFMASVYVNRVLAGINTCMGTCHGPQYTGAVDQHNSLRDRLYSQARKRSHFFLRRAVDGVQVIGDDCKVGDATRNPGGLQKGIGRWALRDVDDGGTMVARPLRYE